MARTRTLTATDAGVNLDRFPGSAHRRDWILMEGAGPWSRTDQDAYQAGEAPCPVCGLWKNEPLHQGGRIRGLYCTGCDKCELDGRCLFPGEPVDSRPNDRYIKASGLPRGRAYRRGKVKGGRS